MKKTEAAHKPFPVLLQSTSELAATSEGCPQFLLSANTHFSLGPDLPHEKWAIEGARHLDLLAAAIGIDVLNR
jgi:hypothetical protein